MTQTPAPAVLPVYTLQNLPADMPPAQAYLILIDWSKTELEALEAGMHGQAGPDRDLQQRAWAVQHAAQQDIVKAALRAGVEPAAIREITWRER